MLTSANRSPTRRHTRCLPSALYSENRDSSVKRTPRQSARCHRMWAFAHLSRLRWWTAVRSRPRWGRRACRWVPWDSFCRNYLVMQTDCCSSCRLVVEKLTLIHGQQLWWTFLQSACHLHAPSKLATSVALCCVIKLHLLEWPFIVASLRHTCAIIMLSNQHLDMPHLWGGWIISAKEKCSLTQI